MDLERLVDKNLEWIAGMQAPNGALPMYPVRKPGDSSKICPYFSEFAGLSLLLRPAKYSDNVRRYMDWHIAHLNTAETDYNGEEGTIYDYVLTLDEDGTFREEIMIDPATGGPLYDSTDSYAGLFLHLLLEYSRTTGDIGYIKSNADAIDRSVKAMLCTLDEGLTWAKPDYKVKYLMDNCEVYRGLCSAVDLYSEILLPGCADQERAEYVRQEIGRLTEIKKKLYESIERFLWNDADDSYYVGVVEGNKGIPEKTDWELFYPDALAQLFPVIMGLSSTENPRAVSLYKKFDQHFSTADTAWEKMKGQRLGKHFINGLIVYNAALMGDFSKVETYMKIFGEKIVDKGFSFPAYNADVAQVALAAEILMKERS